MAIEEKAVWKSCPMNRRTPGQSKEADVAVRGAKKLYLVATNGGDNIDGDYADWISPLRYKGKTPFLSPD